MKIPYDLKKKLCGKEGNLSQTTHPIEVTSIHHPDRRFIPGHTETNFELELYDHVSIQACSDWFESGIALDIGCFIGARVKEMFTEYRTGMKCRVIFHVDRIDENAGSYKDWFIVGDTNYEEGENNGNRLQK